MWALMFNLINNLSQKTCLIHSLSLVRFQDAKSFAFSRNRTKRIENEIVQNRTQLIFFCSLFFNRFRRRRQQKLPNSNDWVKRRIRRSRNRWKREAQRRHEVMKKTTENFNCCDRLLRQCETIKPMCQRHKTKANDFNELEAVEKRKSKNWNNWTKCFRFRCFD